MAQDPGSLANSSPGAGYWRQKARLVQWRLNAAWILDTLQPALFVGAVCATALILLARRQIWADGTLLIWTILIGLCAIGYAVFRARPHLIGAEAARAELESRLRLNARLSAAEAGVGSWPEPREWRSGVFRWHWKRLWFVPALSAALVVAAFNIPIQQQQRRSTIPVVKPPALSTVEEWIEQLQANQAIDPASFEKIKEQAEEIGSQPPSEWYSHSTLEAADHLQSQLEDGMRALSQNSAVLQSLLGVERQLSETEAKRWNEQIDKALSALDGNSPTLNRALAQQMRELDASKLRSLTPEQLQQLQKALQQAGKPGKGLGQNGEGGEGDDTEPGEGTGEGGVNRGPGHPPLNLGADPTNLGTEKTDTLESEDLSRAALGDLAGTSDGQHQVDKEAKYRANNGGNAASQGAGPNAVWIQQSLRPEERQRLRQFYQ